MISTATRRVGGLAAMAALLLGGAATNGPSAGAATATTTPAGAPGAPLPTPVSAIRPAGGDRVTYQVQSGSHLDAVVVDLAASKVLWRVRQYTSRIPGVDLEAPAYAAGPGTVVTAEPNTGKDKEAYPVSIVSHDAATGAIRWRRATSPFLDIPSMCGTQVCVDLDTGTAGATGLLDAATGATTLHTAGLQRVVADDDGDEATPATGDALSIDADGGTGGIAATSGFRNAVRWQRKVADIFGAAEVSPNEGWMGYPTADGGWVLWLGVASAADAKAPDLGWVAGIGPKGERRWLGHWAPCFTLSQVKAVVRCNGTPQQKDANTYVRMVTRIEVIDQLSGAAKATVTLAKPLDDLAPGNRAIRLSPTRWLIQDGSKVVDIDIAAATVRTAKADAVGWCAAEHTSVRVTDDSTGITDEHSSPGFLRPCGFTGSLDPATARARIADGRLDPSANATVTATKVAWVADGKLVLTARKR